MAGNILKESLIDYNETVLKSSRKWLGRHWKGYALFTAISMATPYVVYKIHDKITERKYKKEEEES